MDSPNVTMDLRRTDILTASILVIAGLIILVSLIGDSSGSNYLTLLKNEPLAVVLVLIAITALLLMHVLDKESPDNFHVP